MFKLVGIESILENIIGLCRGYFEGQPSKAALQKALREFLKEVQPRVPKPDGSELCIKSDKDEVAPLLAVFKKESILDDFQEVFDEALVTEQQETIVRMRQALLQMKEVCPTFSQLISLVIHTIFSAPSKHAGGGSTSAAIGCICNLQSLGPGLRSAILQVFRAGAAICDSPSEEFSQAYTSRFSMIVVDCVWSFCLIMISIP